MPPTLPTLGRIVLFRSRTGQYTVPAMVNCTTRSINPDGVAAGRIPLLHDDFSVHLAVLTPGIPPAGVGSRANATDFVAPSRAEVVAGHTDAGEFITTGAAVGENLGGTYQEWDVPYWEPVGADAARWQLHQYDVQPAGTWAWPPR